MFLVAYLKSAIEFIRTLHAQRRLLQALAKRDFGDDYVGHGLSTLWTFIQPLFLVLVYLFIFTWIFPSRVQAPAGMSTDAVVYLLAGIIPWIVFTQILGRASASIVGNSNIVKQMAFPLELLPVKTLTSPLSFGGVALFFVVGYALWLTKGAILPAYVIGIPVLIALSLVFFTGVSLLVGCLQVFARDTKEFIAMFSTIGLFIHPILYFPDAIPAGLRPIVFLSPFSYLIFCWQDVFFFGGIERPWAWLVTAVAAALLFALGARLFLLCKPYFGDFL